MRTAMGNGADMHHTGAQRHNGTAESKISVPPCLCVRRSFASDIQRHLLFANFDSDAIATTERAKFEMYCQRFTADVVAVLLNRLLQFRVSAGSADLDAVSEFEAQILAAVLHNPHKITRETLG